MDTPRNWSDDEIRDYFARKPNLRMQHLARMVGKSMPELKRILMPGHRASAERVASRFMEASDFLSWASQEGKRIGWRVTQRGPGTVLFTGGMLMGSARGDELEVKVTTDRNGNIAISLSQIDTQENRAHNYRPDKFNSNQEAQARKHLSNLLRKMYRYKGSEVPRSMRLAYKMEKGSGGLLFRFGGPRNGLYIQTVPSDPPYYQTYSAATTMSGSGKMALRALGQMWADPKIRRELMRHKRTYEVMDDIDNRLKEMRVRGRLRWHQWHMPD